MAISLTCPAFIDPPGPYASVQEWLAFRDELRRSGLPGIAPFIRAASATIARAAAWRAAFPAPLTPAHLQPPRSRSGPVGPASPAPAS